MSGTAPYEFQVDGGPWQPSGSFLNLPAGNHLVVILDAGGCEDSSVYSISPPTLPQVSLTSMVAATCVSGGAITVNGTSGTAPYEFQVDGGPLQPSGNFLDLPAGNHLVVLLDAGGCEDSNVYSIGPPTLPQVSLTSMVVATCVSGGAITVNGMSGTAPYEFQVDGGPWQLNGSFMDLPVGNHLVVILDAGGCKDSSVYFISPPTPPQDSLVSLVNATCVAGGAIFVNAISGAAPFEYKINGGAWQPNGLFSDLPAGNYAITLRDSTGCTLVSQHAIVGPPLVLDSLLSMVNPTCMVEGAISVAAVSGTSPFEFQIDGGPWQNNGLFSGLSAKTYTITLRDSAGCIHSDNYVLNDPPPALDTLLTLFGAGCVLGGTISVAAISGTAPFQFQIDDGPFQQTGLFINLPAANYTVTLLDAAGCTHSSNYSVPSPPAVFDSLVSLVSAKCLTSGAISVTAVSGTAPFEYQINGGPWQSNGIFFDLPVGMYTILLRDSAGCTYTGNYSIEEETPLILQLDSLGFIDCQRPSGFVAVSASGGSGNYVYHLDVGLGPTSEGYFPELPANIYAVTVTDSAGCKAVLENLEVQQFIDSDSTHETVIIYEGMDFQLPDGTRTARAGQYPFMFETVKGCDSLHVIDLIVLKRHIYVPNVFRPENDGPNNFFTVYADESLEVVPWLAVFDRWGELIFEKENLAPNDEENGWDGQFRERPVNPGVFVWVAKLKFKDGLALTISGDVTVVR